jgi:hypothetical protein
MMQNNKTSVMLFNSPLESGLRTLVLLTHAYPKSYDLQRLISLDYLIIHSEDAGGSTSVHPPTPLRSGELLVKRKLIEKGILLMLSRKLITRQLTKKGIYYKANDASSAFLDSLKSEYVWALRDVVDWVIENYGDKTDGQLESFFKKHLDKWGREFEHTQDAGVLL